MTSNKGKQQHKSPWAWFLALAVAAVAIAQHIGAI